MDFLCHFPRKTNLTHTQVGVTKQPSTSIYTQPAHPVKFPRIYSLHSNTYLHTYLMRNSWVIIKILGIHYTLL